MFHHLIIRLPGLGNTKPMEGGTGLEVVVPWRWGVIQWQGLVRHWYAIGLVWQGTVRILQHMLVINIGCPSP